MNPEDMQVRWRGGNHTKYDRFLIITLVVMLLWLFVLMTRGDDTALAGRITRASYTLPQPSIDKRIKALLEAGFELSWTEPEAKRGWAWMKAEGLPWIRLHAKNQDDETRTLQSILKL